MVIDAGVIVDSFGVAVAAGDRVAGVEFDDKRSWYTFWDLSSCSWLTAATATHPHARHHALVSRQPRPVHHYY